MSEHDAVANGMIEKAQSCLEHIRKVRFGEANASYQIDDGDLRISVNVSVRGIGKVTKDNT